VKVSEKNSSRIYLAFLIVFLVVFSILILVFTRKVTGVSMLPTLEEGDLVVMVGVPINQVSVGDIIIFNDPVFGGCSDFTIIHRVVGISSGGGLMPQGDDRATNPAPDEPQGGPYVSQQCLVGKVVFVVPYIERLAELFPYPVNYILALLIVIFVVYSEFGPRKSGVEAVE
jgi:signal peptidase I